MANTVATSGLGKINWRDIIEGIKIAAVMPALSIIYTSIEAKTFDIDWTLVWQTAVFGAVGYLIKKITTPAQIIVKDPTKEEVESVKDGVATVKVETP